MVNATQSVHPARIAGAARRYWLARTLAAGAYDALLLVTVGLFCSGVWGWMLVSIGATVALRLAAKALGVRAWWFVPWKQQGAPEPTPTRLLRIAFVPLALAAGLWAFSLGDTGRWLAGPFFAYFATAITTMSAWDAVVARRDPLAWVRLAVHAAAAVGVWFWATSLMLTTPPIPELDLSVEASRQAYYTVSGYAAAIGVTVAVLILLMRWGRRPKREASATDER